MSNSVRPLALPACLSSFRLPLFSLPPSLSLCCLCVCVCVSAFLQNQPHMVGLFGGPRTPQAISR